MEIRKLPMSHGWVWFRQTIDLGAKNPRAVFGAALLAIAALYAAVLLMAVLVSSLMLMAGKTEGGVQSVGTLLAVALPLTLLVIVLVPILLGGLMHVLREAESGRQVRARDVFLPLRQAKGRQLAWLGVVQVVLAIVGGMLMVAVAGSDYWRDYMQAMQAAMQGVPPTMPEPLHPGLLFLVQLTFNYFSYALMLFAAPLMLFSGQPLLAALREALRASVRNPGANLLAGALFIAAIVVATLVVAFLASLVGVLGGLVHPVLGGVLAMLVMLGFASVVLVLIVGAAYLAWRDTFGELPPPLPTTMHEFEA